GSAFAGVPAGCSNVFDGSGLCGLPAQTAQQWGDRVHAMFTGYAGRRPRLQLVHGDADGTITYKNLAEAIKEWTNVLGLSMTPSTSGGTAGGGSGGTSGTAGVASGTGGTSGGTGGASGTSTSGGTAGASLGGAGGSSGSAAVGVTAGAAGAASSNAAGTGGTS